jgi:hypothetical protein
MVRNPLKTAGFFIAFCPIWCYVIHQNPVIPGVDLDDLPQGKKVHTPRKIIFYENKHMPKRIPPLSDSQIENVCPGEKPLRLFDGGGLFIEVMPNGSKLWRYKYRFRGKEKKLSFGAYPMMSLSDARLQRSEAQLLRKQGIDPSAVRKLSKSREDAAKMMECKDIPSVRAVIDGTFEIWKGRSVLRLTTDEAQFVKILLDKLL